MSGNPNKDMVTVYVEIPREGFAELRELCNRALDVPVVVLAFKAAFHELMARDDLGPEDFMAGFQDLWRRFEADTETMNSIMQTLMPILSQVKVLDPTGRKEPIQ